MRVAGARSLPVSASASAGARRRRRRGAAAARDVRRAEALGVERSVVADAVHGVRVVGEPVALEHLTEAHAEAVVDAFGAVAAATRLADHEPNAGGRCEVVGRPVRRADVRRALRHQELVVHQTRERDALLRRVRWDLVRPLRTIRLFVQHIKYLLSYLLNSIAFIVTPVCDAMLLCCAFSFVK